MSFLGKLQITQLKRNAGMSPTEARRAKLIAKLQEQLALAQAQGEGKGVVVTRNAWTRDEQGNKQRVQVQRQVRAWWSQDHTGTQMVVRYGARPLELAKGKRAIQIAEGQQIVDVITTLIAAVQAGELDAAMEAAVRERAFGKAAAGRAGKG